MQKKIAVIGGSILLCSLIACKGSLSGQKTPMPLASIQLEFPAATSTPLSHEVQTSTVTLSPTVSLTPTRNPAAIIPVAVGSSIDITYLDMKDESNGWGIGGVHAGGESSHLFRTGDGGLTWTEVTPPQILPASVDASRMQTVGYFPDTNSAWITYNIVQPMEIPQNPVVWRTTDGGKTWQAGGALQNSDLMEYYRVSDVTAAGDSTGWVLAHVGAGMNHDLIALYRTEDGGSTWTRIIDPYSDSEIQGCTKTGIVFTNASSGWLTGDCNGVAPGALLYRTSDGGESWSKINLNVPSDAPDLFTGQQFACGIRPPLVSNGQIYLGVECMDMSVGTGKSMPYLFRSPVDGSAWGSVNYPGGVLFTLDGNRIWALGHDIYRSENGGINWTFINTVTWDGQFDFVSSQLGWAAEMIDTGSGVEYGLVVSHDGASMWALMNPVVAAGI